jgi:hypothetical protein
MALLYLFFKPHVSSLYHPIRLRVTGSSYVTGICPLWNCLGYECDVLLRLESFSISERLTMVVFKATVVPQCLHGKLEWRSNFCNICPLQ